MTGPLVRYFATSINAASAVDQLDQPLCAPDFGERAWLTVARGHRNIILTVHLQGCRQVEVNDGSSPEPILLAPEGLNDAIYAALGIAKPSLQGP